MHEPSLLHVRDHSKATGPAHHMLEYIAQHVNKYTGEAFELTVDRIAYRLQVSSQWVGQLRRQLVEAGELLVKQSRGRHPNVYVIPWERCPSCNPQVEFGVQMDGTPLSDGTHDLNPKVTPNQPQSNPKVGGASGPDPAQIQPPKVFKEVKEKKDGSTPNWTDEAAKAEARSPFWCPACGYATPACVHRMAYYVDPAPPMRGPAPSGHPSTTGNDVSATLGTRRSSVLLRCAAASRRAGPWH
jgi:hypothetical protein